MIRSSGLLPCAVLAIWAGAAVGLASGCAHAPTPAPIETLESSPTPGVHLTARTVRYAVRGRNVHELREHMKRIGPIDDGSHQFAHTWGTYAWNHACARTSDGFRTGPVSIELEIVQTLPEWISRQGASAQTVGEWGRWLAATTAHEEGHRKILLVTAKELSVQLAAIGSQPSCEQVDRAANALGNELLQRMRMQHATYDRATKHGETTGARLRQDLP